MKVVFRQRLIVPFRLMTIQTSRNLVGIETAAIEPTPIPRSCEFDLTLPDPMYQFYACYRDRRAAKPFHSEHWTQAKLNQSVILLNQVVQTFRGSNFCPLIMPMYFEDFPSCLM
ncbi:MAG TPA: hypothetical protein VIE66_11590 [Methylocella sp.]